MVQQMLDIEEREALVPLLAEVLKKNGIVIHFDYSLFLLEDWIEAEREPDLYVADIGMCGDDIHIVVGVYVMPDDINHPDDDEPVTNP